MFLLNPFVFAQSQSVFTLDPAKIKLLLHFDGSLVDSSQNNHTMTSGGNVSISTSEPKFGSGKLQFGDTPTRDGFVKSPNIFDFGNKRPFTISFFYRGGDGNGSFFTTRDMVFGRGGYLVVGNADLSGWTFVLAVMNISSISYQHCAVVGDGTDIKVYRDGSLIASTPHPSWPSASRFIQLGKDGDSHYSNGGMDEFLLYDDVLWTSNFTPPDAPFSY
jgi:hypothetical protein